MSNDNLTVEERLAALESEVASLRAGLDRVSPQGTTLRAPVAIVDADGATLASISSERGDTLVRLFHKEGTCSAVLGVDGTLAGFLNLCDGQGQVLASLDIEQSGGRLVVKDKGRKGGVAVFGNGGDDDGGGINVLSASGTIAAGIWAEEKHGVLTIYDSESEHQILMVPPDEQAGNG